LAETDEQIERIRFHINDIVAGDTIASRVKKTETYFAIILTIA
jgi:hypothetical protein